jgi:HdeA/HdeB family
MHNPSSATALAVVIFVSLATAGLCQEQKDRAVEDYLCRDVMRDSGANRDVAIAFLHGFLLGKSGSSRFNPAVVKAQTDAFVERCLSNPDEKATEAMSAAQR